MTAGNARLHKTVEEALRNQGFTIVFQPIVTSHGQSLGFEALSRFESGCAPDAVWRYAAEIHDAAALDRLAIRKALEAGRHLPGRLFLNLSVIDQLIVERLVEEVEAGQVVWEITETTRLPTESVEAVEWLRAHGHTIAMDDAGTGRSTAGRLRMLQPEVVKLDKAVVQTWASGQKRALREWVRQATTSGATVLAEGIEVDAWIPALVLEGVEAFQGYAIGRPASPEIWHKNYQYLPGGGGG